MKKFVIALAMTVIGTTCATAQQSTQAAYAKFMELTRMFQGKEPYSCFAIAEVKYKSRSMRVTSLLIYKGGSTFYKSKLVERVEAPEGELVINHQLKTASFFVSDSVKQLVMQALNLPPETELESMLDSNFEQKDLEAFSKYVVQSCNVVWDNKGGLEEISFNPKKPKESLLLSVIIRFSKDNKIRYYEYTERDVYATDYYGRPQFRIVRTIYDGFNYENVPDIPSRLADFLEWKGLSVKLKKYTNYKLSLL